MSLLDAMLLEPYRDPRDIWIAQRSDGQRGSGTLADPYDGGTRLGPALDATLTFNQKEFVVGLLNHGLSAGNQVKISGVQAPGDPIFNGDPFMVHQVLSQSHFTILLGDVPTAPPNVRYSYTLAIQATIPYNSTDPKDKKDVRLYWPVAKVTVPANHGLSVFDGVNISGISPIDYAGDHPILGPNGPSGTVFAYRLKFLPGADVTTPLNCTVRRLSHRFDEIMRGVPIHSVIHLGSGTFETRGFASLHISDADNYAKLYVGYILRAGQHLLGAGIGASTLKLVLPLDDLTQTTAVGNPSYPNASYAGVADLTIDCNAAGHAAPHGIFPAPVTCGAVALGGSFISLRRVRAINFCVQAYPECFALFLSPTGDGPAPTFNVIEDCIAEQPGLNNTHETTVIGNVGSVHGNAVSPIVRHNYVNCTFVQDDGSRFSSEYVALASLSAPSNNEFTLTTKRPHNRVAGQNVLLNGVLDANTSPRAGHPYFFGPFKIKSLDTTTPLTKMTCEFLNPPANFPPADVSRAYIGVDFHGPSATAGTGCVTEGNALYDCAVALYSDTGTQRDGVVRDNYYSNIGIGAYFNFNSSGGGGASEPRKAGGLSRDPSNEKMATLTIPVGAAQIEVSVGDAVTVNGARIGTAPGQDAPDGTYNGTYVVSWVASDKRSFSYEMKSPVGSNANAPTADLPILVRSRWQIRRLVYENNVCDLYAFDSNSAVAPWGVVSIGFAPTPANELAPGPPFMFPQAVIRENTFQHINNIPAAVAANGIPSFAFRILSFEDTAIEHNLIGLSDPHVIHFVSGRNVRAFGNRAPGGSVLPYFEDVGTGGTGPFQEQESLDTKVADAVLMSFL